jgi:hypothetical protein
LRTHSEAENEVLIEGLARELEDSLLVARCDSDALVLRSSVDETRGVTLPVLVARAEDEAVRDALPEPQRDGDGDGPGGDGVPDGDAAMPLRVGATLPVVAARALALALGERVRESVADALVERDVVAVPLAVGDADAVRVLVADAPPVALVRASVADGVTDTDVRATEPVAEPDTRAVAVSAAADGEGDSEPHPLVDGLTVTLVDGRALVAVRRCVMVARRPLGEPVGEADVEGDVVAHALARVLRDGDGVADADAARDGDGAARDGDGDAVPRAALALP